MPAPFAALEARVNTAVFKRLSNADATLDGVPVQGMFEKAYALGEVGASGMASSQPIFTLATSAVPANPVGTALVVNSVTYTVAAHEPDGTGVSLLYLEATS